MARKSTESPRPTTDPITPTGERVHHNQATLLRLLDLTDGPPILEAPLRRVAVTGVYGAGKSTLGARLAAATRLPFHDYDAVKWRDGLGALATILETERWIVAGGERHTEAQIWDRADAIVWLDPSLAVILWRALRRSLSDEQGGGVWDPQTRRRVQPGRRWGPVAVRAVPAIRDRRRGFVRSLESRPCVRVTAADSDRLVDWMGRPSQLS